MDRHVFLAALHELLQPRGYLEIGVQTGASLRLSRCPSLGIDPAPVLRFPLTPTTRLAQMTSDDFFALPESTQRSMGVPEHVDLAFIDGMHLHEFALRDFANVERFANPRTVVVFDDVLPRNQAEAVRTPLPGDWTGDVWRVADVLASLTPGVRFALVDTQPTGCLVAWGLWPERERTTWVWTGDEPPVPDDVLKRTFAVAPEAALEMVAEVAE